MKIADDGRAIATTLDEIRYATVIACEEMVIQADSSDREFIGKLIVLAGKMGTQLKQDFDRLKSELDSPIPQPKEEL